MSSIQDKVFEKENDTKKKDSNDWNKFLKYFLYFFVLSLLIMIVGSNFIFIRNATESEMNYFLPIDIYTYFKAEQLDKDEINSYRKNSKIKPPYIESWPYNMRKTSSITNGVLQSLKNWIANTIAETYIMNRELTKNWINLFSSINNKILIYIIAIITFLFFPFVYIGSFFISLYNSIKTNWLWGILSMLFIILWPFITIISIVFLIKFIGLFTIMPAYYNVENFKKILKSNINLFFIFFGGLISIASIKSLNTTISIIYTSIYLLLIIISLVK